MKYPKFILLAGILSAASAFAFNGEPIITVSRLEHSNGQESARLIMGDTLSAEINRFLKSGHSHCGISENPRCEFELSSHGELLTELSKGILGESRSGKATFSPGQDVAGNVIGTISFEGAAAARVYTILRDAGYPTHQLQLPVEDPYQRYPEFKEVISGVSIQCEQQVQSVSCSFAIDRAGKLLPASEIKELKSEEKEFPDADLRSRD